MGKTKTIGIIGPIGTFTYQGVEICGVQLVDIVAKINALEKDVDTLIVELDTPGGNAAVGESMYKVLLSIQPRIKVVMRQIGDIRSVGTVIWFAAPLENRIAAIGENPNTGKPFKFGIHMPWLTQTSGNANKLEGDILQLREREEEFVKFYAEQTGVDEALIKPLLDADSEFDAEKAVELKFAGKTYEAHLIAAYNMTKTKDDENSGLAAGLRKLLGIKDTVAVAPPDTLKGQAVMINGAAAPDGVYTVAGGLVTAVADSAAPAPAAPLPTQAAAQPAPAATAVDANAILKAINDNAAASNAAILALADATDKKLVALGKTMTSGHVPVGYTAETKEDLKKAWDTTFKANQHAEIKRTDPEKYQAMFFAKYGRVPN
jgi:ATP-dependent protease ClpP protease subunit